MLDSKYCCKIFCNYETTCKYHIKIHGWFLNLNIALPCVLVIPVATDSEERIFPKCTEAKTVKYNDLKIPVSQDILLTEYHLWYMVVHSKKDGWLTEHWHKQ